MLVFCLIHFVLALDELNQYSFKSPLLPNHKEKFRTLGEAIPLRKFVRLAPPKKNMTGGIETTEHVKFPSFEMKVTFNFAGEPPAENQGLSMWFSEKPEPLGDIYGLTPSFRGLSLFLDISTSRLYASQITQDLSIDEVVHSNNCELSMNSRQKTLHIHFNATSFEVWVKEKKMRLCTSIFTQGIGDIYFGISTYSGKNTYSVFDILEVITSEVAEEETENDNSTDTEGKLLNELSALEENLKTLDNNVKGFHQSQEFKDIFAAIQRLHERLRDLFLKTIEVKKKMAEMHKDQEFIERSNKEIMYARERFSYIEGRVGGIKMFLDENKAMAEIKGSLLSQYEKVDNNGKLLKTEYSESVERLLRFIDQVKGDYRIRYLHIAFFIFLVSVIVLFSKVFGIEKVKIIAKD